MNLNNVEWLCRALLMEIGEDPNREGLQGTPKRWAKWWQEFVEYKDDNLTTSFQSIVVDQLVALSGIRVWTLCEHHLLPFWCDITIAYLSADRVVGISKLARIARMHAHGLNVQERLVKNIADSVVEVSGSKSVAVLAHGEHLCMSMRGIKTSAIMHSNDMRGVFRDSAAARMELMSMVGNNGRSLQTN